MIYDFVCTNCKEEVDLMISLLQYEQGNYNKACPICGKKTLVRKINAPVFSLKGIGWSFDNYGLMKNRERTKEEKEQFEKQRAENS